jgi:hypothetical protein
MNERDHDSINAFDVCCIVGAFLLGVVGAYLHANW